MIEIEFRDLQLQNIIGVNLYISEGEYIYTLTIYNKDYFLGSEKLKKEYCNRCDTGLFLVDNVKHIVNCLTDIPENTLSIKGYQRVSQDKKGICFETVNYNIRIGSVQSWRVFYEGTTYK